VPFSARQFAAAIRKADESDSTNLVVFVTVWVLVHPTVKVAALDAVPGENVYENEEFVAICERVMVVGRDGVWGCGNEK
jgi:hypothetical protein